MQTEHVQHRRHRRRSGGPVGRLSPGAARRPVRDPRRATRGSATRGASAGTRSASSRRRGTTASTACRSPRRPAASRPRTRWRTTSRPTRARSSCRSAPACASTGSRGDGDRFLVAAGDPALRGRQRRRRDGELPEAARAGSSRTSSTRRSSSSTPATTGTRRSCAGGRAGRRRRQLGRGDRASRSRGTHHRPGWPGGHRPRAVPHRQPRRAR